MSLITFRSLISVLSVLSLHMSIAQGTAQNASSLQESLVTNPGFEETQENNGVTIPTYWAIHRYKNTETMMPRAEATEGATGRMAVAIPACGTGGIGFITYRAKPLSSDVRGLSVNLRFKVSADCTAVPWIFVAWTSKGNYVSNVALPLSTTGKADGAWHEFSQELPAGDIPAQADGFQVMVGVMGKEKAAPAGTIWYDDVVVSVQK